MKIVVNKTSALGPTEAMYRMVGVITGCPQCGSDDIAVAPFDFGRCAQTGYHDAGERWACRGCGAVGDVEEIVSNGNSGDSTRERAAMSGNPDPGNGGGGTLLHPEHGVRR